MQLAFRILDLAARLLMALGVGCLLLGAWLAWNNLTFEREGVRTTAEVVSYFEVPDGDQVKYLPRVRFKTEGGDIISAGTQLKTDTRRFEIGTKVPVVYQRADPMKVRITLFTDNWLGASIAVVIGIAGVAGGLLVRRSVRRDLAKMQSGQASAR
jgi:hypothetical protein